MADPRIAPTSPATALDALGIVDLSDPGPSQAPRQRSHSQTPPTLSQSQRSEDRTNETLGLPPDAQVVRVPEGERYRVRAVYDFDATDESALSFRAGDVIEVLTMLPSGWWDGMLGTSRGWFPSNYVEDVEEGELDDEDEEEGFASLTHDQRYIEISPDGRAVARNGSMAMDERWDEWNGEENGASLDDIALELMGGRHRDQTADADETTQPRPRRGARRNDEWVPSITPDGRVYYHNTQTGEEAWSIPGAREGFDMSANTSQNGDGASDAGRYQGEYDLRSHQRRIRGDSVASSAPSRPLSGMLLSEEFRPPPSRAQSGPSGLPHPWTARLSDDGRGWYYFNQVTGESRRDPPSLNRDGSDTPLSTIGAHGPSSLSSHRRTDLEDRIRSSLAPLYAPPLRPTIGMLVESLNLTISQIYDAAVEGISADEELAVARNTHNGLALAIQHDEAANERASESLEAVVSAVRDLVVAFGYVGPVISPTRGYDSSIPEDIMQRPKWAANMNLVGTLGLLQFMTHGAITGPRIDRTRDRDDENNSPWGNVMRAATKLRGVIDGMPSLILAEEPGVDRATAKGRRLAAWFGADALGDFMSGRFGFGPSHDQALRPLDQTAVVDIQRLKADVDAAIRGEGVVEVLRVTSRFREAISLIDVAIVIDLDGDLNDMTNPESHHEDARAYADLISKARHALRELDDTALALDSAAADVYLRSEENAAAARDGLTGTVAAVFRALSSLLVVAQQQAAMLEHGHVRGSLGARSPMIIARRAAAAAHARKQSQASLESRTSAAEQRRGDGSHARNASGASNDSQRTRTTEAEFLEQDEPAATPSKRRSRRLSRVSQSGSASQTSLHENRQSSSTTSLPYQQEPSESGSVRGPTSNRASILKAVPSFLRTRGMEEAARAKSGRKLTKLLGEDGSGGRSLGTIPAASQMHAPPPAPMAAPPAAAIRSEPAWYLGNDYPVGEIVFDDKGGVKAGTIRALVVRLTTHVAYDNAFFQAFLLTFRAFVAPEDLIELLIERYNIAAPEDLPPDQREEWKLRKQTPVRLRVANTLKAWLDNHYVEKEDSNVLNMIEDFTKVLMANGNELISRQLQALVERKRRGDGDAQSRRVMTGTQTPPAPIIPRVSPGKPLQLLDISPLEIARQLTIMESLYFQRIKLSECLHKAWTTDNAAEISPNVGHVIYTANRLAGWVQLAVLRQRDMKLRASTLKHLIRVASELRVLNNYSSMAGVVAGLSASAISRLKKTWEQLSDKTTREWHDLEVMMDSTRNFQKYKEMLKTTNPPCVPFLGFYLSALVFIEDGNRDMVMAPPTDGSGSVPMTPTASQSAMPRRPSGTSTQLSRTSTAWSNGSTLVNGEVQPATPGLMLINFFKRQLTADILRDIQQYQSQPYSLAPCKPVSGFIEQNLDAVADETQDLYDISLSVEPKDVK